MAALSRLARARRGWGFVTGDIDGYSRHFKVGIEQLDFEPVSLARLRHLVQALAAGEPPAVATTMDPIRHLEEHPHLATQ